MKKPGVYLPIIMIIAAMLAGCTPEAPQRPDFCQASSQADCAQLPGCEWQSKGGRITPHYLCCPTDESKWPYRCTIIVD